MKKIEELTKDIIQTLASEKRSITFAESCTGGRIAATFTAIPGASEVLNGACITYSNKIKTQWLGVEEEILLTEGAVSQACVDQMLSGIIKMANADYAIAVSGIAGPGGGTPLKPVGTVFIGISTPSQKEIFHCHFSGDREQIQQSSVDFAITQLAKFLLLYSRNE